MHRHATDVISLVFGTILAGLAVIWFLDLTNFIDGQDAWLGGPVVLIAAGAAGLVVSLRPDRERDDTEAGLDFDDAP